MDIGLKTFVLDIFLQELVNKCKYTDYLFKGIKIVEEKTKVVYEFSNNEILLQKLNKEITNSKDKTKSLEITSDTIESIVKILEEKALKKYFVMNQMLNIYNMVIDLENEHYIRSYIFSLDYSSEGEYGVITVFIDGTIKIELNIDIRTICKHNNEILSFGKNNILALSYENFKKSFAELDLGFK